MDYWRLMSRTPHWASAVVQKTNNRAKTNLHLRIKFMGTNLENKNKKTNLYQIIEEDINHEKLIADNKNKKIGFG